METPATREADTIPSDLEIRPARVEEILDLRQRVLIVGTNRTSPEFEGDQEPETLHFGVFQSGQALACLTFLCRPYEGDPGFQLRGMAVHPDWRIHGLGRALLRLAERQVRSLYGEVRLWCNARTPAVPFYLKQGWSTVGPEFMIEGVGPHFRMTKLQTEPGQSAESVPGSLFP